jgi:hypothetical protein
VVVVVPVVVIMVGVVAHGTSCPHHSPRRRRGQLWNSREYS